jgi:hypothetical protein
MKSDTFIKNTSKNGLLNKIEYTEVQKWSTKDKLKREEIFNEVGQEYKQINLLATAMFKMISLPERDWANDEDIKSALEAFNKINTIKNS